MAKIAVITGFLGEVRDRFCTYNRPRSIIEKLEAAARIPGLDGVEIIYPYDFQDPEAVEKALSELGLGVSAVNVNVKSEPEFAAGSLTSPDPEIRAKAVRFLKEGLDMAHRLGAGRVTVCPLSDGHDYPFQAEYEEEWRRLKEAFAHAAAHRPEVTLSLEYKPSESRVRSTLAGAYSSMLLVQEIGRETGLTNLGVTVDVGHSLYGGENPAQALTMLHYYGIRPYLHLNDNYRNWDWDLMPGSVNFWDLVEFFWTAFKNGYDDWVTLDVFPARMDPEACFATSARMVQVLAGVARRIDAEELAALRRTTPPEQMVPALTEYVWKKAGLLGERGV